MIINNENWTPVRWSDGIYEGSSFDGSSIHRSFNVVKKVGTAGNLERFGVVEMEECASWDEEKILHFEPMGSEEAADTEFEYMVEANDSFTWCSY